MIHPTPPASATAGSVRQVAEMSMLTCQMLPQRSAISFAIWQHSAALFDFPHRLVMHLLTNQIR
jgi:hypothetical protein